MLDRNSRIPLYYQLAEQIREQIVAGELGAGAQLPAEREMAERHAISRMTARQAIAHLVRQGVLIAKIGVGTFVAEPKLSFDAVHLLGFTERMLSQGMRITSTVLEQALVLPPKLVSGKLKLRPKDKVVKIARVRLHDNEPLALETVFVPANLAPGLASADLQQHSLYALLENTYHLRLGALKQTLEATIANDYEAQLLHVAVGMPMILLEGVTFRATKDAQPVEYFKAVFRGDRFRFTLDSDESITLSAAHRTGAIGVHTNGAILKPILR